MWSSAEPCGQWSRMADRTTYRLTTEPRRPTSVLDVLFSELYDRKTKSLPVGFNNLPTQFVLVCFVRLLFGWIICINEKLCINSSKECRIIFLIPTFPGNLSITVLQYLSLGILSHIICIYFTTKKHHRVVNCWWKLLLKMVSQKFLWWLKL